jgi:hypothetical protein
MLSLALKAGQIPENLISFYAPLAIRLGAVLASSGLSLTFRPFDAFFHIIISLYMNRILGSTGASYVRAVGCDRRECHECRYIHRFLSTTRTDFEQYMISRALLPHIEDWVKDAKDLISISYANGSGMRARVTLQKSKTFYAAQQWDTRLQEATQFLAGLGNQEQIMQLMGEKYQDLVQALHGQQVYVFDQALLDQFHAGGCSSRDSIQVAPQYLSNINKNAVIGQKRGSSEESGGKRICYGLGAGGLI